MSDYLTQEERNNWHQQCIKSKLKDFTELKNWLIEKNIKFEETFFGIELDDFKISNTLKLKFPNNKKQYHYNLEGIKKKLANEFTTRI